MSVKSTEELTREQAIYIITQARLEIAKKEYELSLIHLTNKDLEELLEVYCYDEFKNYSVYTKE